VGLLDKIRTADFADDSTGEIDGEINGGTGVEFTPDPAPGKSARSARSASSPPAPARPRRKPAPPAIRRQLTDEIEAYLVLGAGAWQMRDEVCGAVLEKQAREIASRLAAILGKNPAIVEWLHTSGVIGEWVALAMAIKPVWDVIRAHHITKTVEEGDGAPVDIAGYPAYRPAA
jgi:hypothetical protein